MDTTAIIKEYGKMVSSICRRMIYDRDLARDAAQEVWMEVLKSLPTFRGESKVSTWIYTIARRTVLRFTKNEKQNGIRWMHRYYREPVYDIPEDKQFAIESWVREICESCLTAILYCLENEARLIYIFRKMAGLPYAEIARIMEKNESSIRQSVSRSSRRLNRFMTKECGLYNPSGGCNCRMRSYLKESELLREYEKIRKTMKRINVLLETESILPGRNYWEKFTEI